MPTTTSAAAPAAAPVVAAAPVLLPALTGVRLVAAVWVVAYHLREHLVELLPGLHVLLPVLEGGPLGVDLFFVLSGFILAHTYAERFAHGVDRRAYLGFLRRRLARIYPVHLVTLHALVLVVVVSRLLDTYSGVHASRRSYLENLLLVQAWFGADYTWNVPAWSVSAEWFAYLLFPLAVPYLARVRSSWGAWVGFLVPLALFQVTSALGWGTGAAFAPEAPLLRVATAFTAGCFAHRLHRLHPSTGRWWGAAVPLLVAAVVALCFLGDPFAWVQVPLLALVVLGLAHGSGPAAWLLSRRWAVYGGEASYALYMVQGLVIVLLLRHVAGLTDASLAVRLGVLAAWVLALALAAVLVLELVEKPARRRWVRGRTRPTGGEGPAVGPGSSYGPASPDRGPDVGSRLVAG